MTRKAAVFTGLVVVALTIAALIGCKPIPYYLQEVYKASGRVVEDGSGAPLESVEVFLHPYQYSVLTNGLGDYGIELPEGTWTLDYVRDGYTKESRTVTVNANTPRVNMKDVRMGRVGAVSIAQAALAAQTVAGTWSLVSGRDREWSVVGSAVSFSTAGLSMAGTKTPGQYGNDIYVLTLTLSNYSDAATGYAANGSVNVTNSGGGGTITANVTLSGGPVTTETWDVTYDNSGIGTVTGTITCNGTSFDAGTISAANTQNAVRAWQTLFSGIITVVENQGSWTVDGSYISYSTTGLAMTGTHKVVGSIETFDMVITYSSYAGNFIYTVNSGTARFVEKIDSSLNELNGTFAADLILSGGPVTTLKCTDVKGTYNMQPQLVKLITGTVYCNDIAFDAKTMPWND